MQPILVTCFWKRVNAIRSRDYKKAQQWDRLAMGQCALYGLPINLFYAYQKVCR